MTTRLRMTDRRDQLVDAALAVASRDGLAAATVREVAREADVATGVVHYCFADKDDLLSAMAEQIVRELAAAGGTGRAVRGDLAAVLAAGVRGLWRGIETAPGRQLLTYEITVTALRSDAMRGAAVRQYAVSAAAVTHFLAEAATSAAVRWVLPVDDVAAVVLAQIDGVTLRWLVDRDSRAARRRLDRFARMVAGLAVSVDVGAAPVGAGPVA